MVTAMAMIAPNITTTAKVTIKITTTTMATPTTTATAKQQLPVWLHAEAIVCVQTRSQFSLHTLNMPALALHCTH